MDETSEQNDLSRMIDSRENTGGGEITTSVVVKFDGGARPNPGPAAIGYLVETDDSTEEGSHQIGESTNNRAEYHALIRGLEVASERGYIEVEARGDSRLIVNQVTGDWDTNEQQLRELRNRVQELADEFERFEIQYIPREENWEADKLVNQAFLD